MTFGPLPLNTVPGAFLLAFPALFSIINPFGSALVFFNMAARLSHADRVALARQVSVYGLLLLLGSILLGSYVLNFFGVSLGALRLGGGLVVAVTSWTLLTTPDPPTPEVNSPPASPDELASKAFFPLTMPITTGPGTISVAIAVASERPVSGVGVLAFFSGVSLAATAIMVIIYLLYAGADRLIGLIGPGGARVISRLMAFLLLCIGVQIMASGAEALISPWLSHLARPAA